MHACMQVWVYARALLVLLRGRLAGASFPSVYACLAGCCPCGVRSIGKQIRSRSASGGKPPASAADGLEMRGLRGHEELVAKPF